jgi:CheY-like chemotaxis protein
MPQIFDAFEQGGRTITSQYGGLGLGLAICKRVIDLHSGSITVHSEGKGRGATFTVTLNAMATSMLEGPVLFLESEPPRMKHIQILFVEDHEDTARVLGRILRNAGFDVSHAGTVAEARRLAVSKRFDLLVSDLGLPDGSGLELMKALRDTQGLKGIALSGFGTDEDVAASVSAGFAAHLTKPVDWERLRVRWIERGVGEARNIKTSRGGAHDAYVVSPEHALGCDKRSRNVQRRMSNFACSPFPAE